MNERTASRRPTFKGSSSLYASEASAIRAGVMAVSDTPKLSCLAARRSASASASFFVAKYCLLRFPVSDRWAGTLRHQGRFGESTERYGSRDAVRIPLACSQYRHLPPE